MMQSVQYFCLAAVMCLCGKITAFSAWTNFFNEITYQQEPKYYFFENKAQWSEDNLIVLNSEYFLYIVKNFHLFVPSVPTRSCVTSKVHITFLRMILIFSCLNQREKKKLKRTRTRFWSIGTPFGVNKFCRHQKRSLLIWTGDPPSARQTLMGMQSFQVHMVLRPEDNAFPLK